MIGAFTSMLVKHNLSAALLIYITAYRCSYHAYSYVADDDATYTLTPAQTEYVDTLHSDPRDYGLREAEPSTRKVLRVDRSQLFDYNPVVLEEIPQLEQPKTVKLQTRDEPETYSNRYDLFYSKVARERTSTTAKYRMDRHEVGSMLSDLNNKIQKRVDEGLEVKYSSKLWNVYDALSGVVDRLDDSVGTYAWKKLRVAKLLSLIKELIDNATVLVKMVEKDRMYDLDELETFLQGCDSLIEAAEENVINYRKIYKRKLKRYGMHHILFIFITMIFTERVFILDEHRPRSYISRIRKDFHSIFVPPRRTNKYVSVTKLHALSGSKKTYNELLLDYQIRYQILNNQADDNAVLRNSFQDYLDEMVLVFRMLYKLRTSDNYSHIKMTRLTSDVKHVLTSAEALFAKKLRTSRIKSEEDELIRALNILKYDLLDLAVCDEISGKKSKRYSSECPICFEDYDLVYAPCGHGFQLTCLYKWMLEKRTCPCCGRTLLPDVDPADGLDIE